MKYCRYFFISSLAIVGKASVVIGLLLTGCFSWRFGLSVPKCLPNLFMESPVTEIAETQWGLVYCLMAKPNLNIVPLPG